MRCAGYINFFLSLSFICVVRRVMGISLGARTRHRVTARQITIWEYRLWQSARRAMTTFTRRAKHLTGLLRATSVESERARSEHLSPRRDRKLRLKSRLAIHFFAYGKIAAVVFSREWIICECLSFDGACTFVRWILNLTFSRLSCFASDILAASRQKCSLTALKKFYSSTCVPGVVI